MWRGQTREQMNASCRRYHRRKRREVIDGLGAACEGCGETDYVLLTVDHIHGGGNAHRRALNKNGNTKNLAGSTVFFNAILREGLPKDKYRCLCWNCQHKAKLGYPLPTKMADPRLIEVGA